MAPNELNWHLCQALKLPGRSDLRFSFETKRGAGFGAVLLLTLVACGGGAAAPTTAPRASTVAPTQPPAASAAASVNATIVVPTTLANPGSATIEACALLTPAEVGAASELTLDTATKGFDQIYSYCTYSGENDDEVKTYVTQNAAAITTAFGTVKINKGEAVTGVGDDAFWSNDGFAPGLYFTKGGALAYIEGSTTGPDSPIVELGKLMATRM